MEMTTQNALAIVKSEASNSVQMSFRDIEALAEAVAKSKLFPSAKTKEEAFALMALCQSEGLHPMQAVRRFHIIQGQVAMKADAVLAEFQSRGGIVEWLEYNHERVRATFAGPGSPKPVEVKWDVDDAKKAGLAGKDNWKNYTRQMLKARVITDGVRLVMPGVLVGLPSEEEAMDMEPRHAPAAVLTATVTKPAIEAKPAEEPIDAEVSEVAPPPAEETPKELDAKKVKDLQAWLSALGIGTEGAKRHDYKGAQREEFIRAERLAWISGVVGRSVESSKLLSDEEWSKCCAEAKRIYDERKAAQPGGNS